MSRWRCFMVDGPLDAYTDDDGPTNFLVGAMWWRRHVTPVSGMDTDPRPMPHLAVMTPAGMVCLHCPASLPPAGRYWVVEGDPPHVTVTPSLGIRGAHPWHGWLSAGELRDA